MAGSKPRKRRRQGQRIKSVASVRVHKTCLSIDRALLPELSNLAVVHGTSSNVVNTALHALFGLTESDRYRAFAEYHRKRKRGSNGDYAAKDP